MLFASRPTGIRRLLIIEDDPLIAFDNEHTLKQSGYDIVATVDSGEAAVPIIAAEQVDALVLDLGLAGHMTGREVARLARDRDIAVLLVTGQCPDDASDIAVACLGKPYSPAALVAALRAVETMTCANRAPRRVSGLRTYWRPAAV
ncbi:MAG: response regulator [Sphingopyxis sp.]|nr:response regulator [Sphingopyxis sp.]